MKKQPRLIVFETCGYPEALLMRLLLLLGRPVSAVHFVEGVEPPTVQALPLHPQHEHRQERCLQDLIDEAYEVIERVSHGSRKNPGDFYERLSLAICAEDLLQDELRIAMKATLKRHAYPTALIRILLEEDCSRIVLITRTRIRRKILQELTQIRTICIPFSDWPLKFLRSLRFGSHNPGASSFITETRVPSGKTSSTVLFFHTKDCTTAICTHGSSTSRRILLLHVTLRNSRPLTTS